MFQLRTGADLERDMGWWRISIIYMTSGIAGFIFGGNFAPLLSRKCLPIIVFSVPFLFFLRGLDANIVQCLLLSLASMGASGAIFGLIGCLVLDLIQNWKLVVRPCWELSKVRPRCRM